MKASEKMLRHVFIIYWLYADSTAISNKVLNIHSFKRKNVLIILCIAKFRIILELLEKKIKITSGLFYKILLKKLFEKKVKNYLSKELKIILTNNLKLSKQINLK